jgi:hypothetical protein
MRQKRLTEAQIAFSLQQADWIPLLERSSAKWVSASPNALYLNQS